ncbi:MAG: DegT/DnrJ/EryC1/StrS family aminotransferase [Pseudomonadota bacterium]
MNTSVPFIDLKAQQARVGARIEERIRAVLAHGQFIMGPEVAQLEAELAAFCGARHCISCASGTDALVLALMAMGIGPGQAVFVPAFTFVATAEAPALLGATPVFVDVLPDSFNMDPVSLRAAIGHARQLGLVPAAAIPVDLFGLPADYTALREVAAEFGLRLVADAAQSFGGSLDGQRVGTLAEATATSFFPAKPLGCYGDGGAVFTDDDDLAATMKSLRVHGQGTDKYDNVRVGLNARLDTIQAAVLLEKLAILADEIVWRGVAARRYCEALSGVVGVPAVAEGRVSAWAQYTILCDRRDQVAAFCKAAGVPTAVYYPRPLHRQTGYARCPTAPEGCATAETLSARVLSLPMHPYLDVSTQERVAEAVRRAVGVR